MFVDTEKIYSNMQDDLVAKQFSSLPPQEEQFEAIAITMKSDLNSNNC
jgi:hypothetical protein